MASARAAPGAGAVWGRFELKLEGGEYLAHLVVQLARDRAPFRLLHAEEPVRHRLQLASPRGDLGFQRAVEVGELDGEPRAGPLG